MRKLLYTAIILLLLSSSLMLVVLVYEKDISEMVTAQAGKYFRTKTEAGDVHLSVFKRFPQVTVVLKDVRIEGLPAGSNNEMAKAGRVLLSMDLFNLIRKKYIVERIEVSDLDLNLEIFSDGSNNFEVLKSQESTASGQAEDFTFKLENIKISGCRLHYTDKTGNINLVSFIEKAEMKGNFNSASSEIEAKIQSVLESFSIENRTYIKDKNLLVTGKLVYNNLSHGVTFKQTSFKLNEAEFLLNGLYEPAGRPGKFLLDFSLDSRQFELADLASLLPETQQKKYSHYKYAGLINFKATIKGLYSGTDFPAVKAVFETEDASFSNTREKVNLDRISLKGSYQSSPGDTHQYSKLELNRFSCMLMDREIRGSFFLEDKGNSLIRLKAEGTIDLEKLHNLLQLEQVKDMQGEAAIKVNIEGYYNDLKKGKNNNTTMQGTISLKNAGIDFKDYSFKGIEGLFIIREDEITAREIKGAINGSDFAMNGAIVNLPAWLLDNKQTLVLMGSLASKKTDMNKLIVKNEDDKKEKPGSIKAVKPLVPENIKISLSIDFKELVYERFKATDIKGRLKTAGGVLSLDSLHFQAASGKVSMSGKMKPAGKLYLVTGRATVKKINIPELFTIFNDWKQDYITARHVKGLGSGDIMVNTYWDQDFNHLLDKLYVLTDITIDNGELNNFDPLINLLGFIKMKKMKNVVFEHIETSLVIKDKKVIIPGMELNSNAFSIFVSGEHGFDNSLEYKLKINLNKFFFPSERRSKTEFTDSEDDQKGGLNLYVVMWGKGDDIDYRFDRSMIKKQMENNYQEEKKELKEIFKKNQKKQTVTEQEFEWEWEEEAE